VGLLPTSAEGFRYLFTLVDRSTRWVEAVHIKTMSAVDCADAFIATWVSRFGVPANLTLDRGAQFTAAVWYALCLKLGVSQQMTTAYHPQSNGIVERTHRQLEDPSTPALQWAQHLPWVLLGLRAAPKEDSGISSAELAYGAPLSLPGQFITAEEPPPATFVEKLRSASPLPPTSSPHMRRWRQSPPLLSWPRSSSMSGEAGLFRPWSRSTWFHTRYWITGPRCFA
jgi:transposase InsO family protein